MKKMLILLWAFSSAALACQPYFSLNGGGTQAVVDLIGAAHVSVRLLAYSFTSAPIGEALVAAHQRGVDVQLVLDKSVTTQRSLLARMRQAGVPVWIDAAHRIQHNKVLIVDAETVETGSFNYSAAAEKHNAENLLVCRDEGLAAHYTADFKRHQAHSEVAK